MTQLDDGLGWEAAGPLLDDNACKRTWSPRPLTTRCRPWEGPLPSRPVYKDLRLRRVNLPLRTSEWECAEADLAIPRFQRFSIFLRVALRKLAILRGMNYATCKFEDCPLGFRWPFSS